MLAVGVVCAVGGTWVAKLGLEYIDKIQLLFWSLVPATIIFGVLSFGSWGQIPSIFHNSGTRNAVLFGAIMNGIVTYLFSFYALKRIKGEEYGIFEYIDPAVAAFVAIIFFGEKFTPLIIGGVIIIFFGLYLAEARHHKVLHPLPHSLKRR